MKRFYPVLASLLLVSACFVLANISSAKSDPKPSARENLASQNIVIYQLYGGGGNSSSSQFSHDFLVLSNRSDSAVSLDGWSTQYASSSGSNWLVAPLSDVMLQPGQYYLIQYATNGNGGASLPTPDLVAPPVTVNGNTFIPNMSSSNGKLALVNSTNQLPASTCPSDPSIVDLVGYGSATCFEGQATSSLSSTTAVIRNAEGCDDTDNNSDDFTIGTPMPRNTSSSTNTCDIGSELSANGAASPSTVTPNSTTLLTVQVFPATSPPSTGVGVLADLTNLSGSASQTFFDDGTNGDVTVGDNIYSYLATIPANAGGGQVVINGVVSDAQARTANALITLTINAPPTGEDPLLLGNPSNATADIVNENNYLMQKEQYSLSYSRANATPNWVAWRLDSTWVGSAPRQNDYRPDPSLPAGWYQVDDNDYSGSGYTRGHICPSADRTRSVADNSATFLMTNFVPQIFENNGGAWVDFESYLRSLANQGKEVYTYSGGAGNIGTIAGGEVVVPAVTWKVVLILENGNNDLQRINKGTRTIAIVVPNQLPLNASTPWREFRTNVDAVEYLTGFNFFTNVPKNTQEIIERRRDIE